MLHVYFHRYFFKLTMINTILRIVIGIIFYEIGLFWACITVCGTLFRVFLGGRKGLVKFFHKKKHDKIPEFAANDYDHDYVRTRSGLRFHYVHAGDEENPLMLCLHGFPECWYSWKHVIKSCSTNYYVVAIDMRGYGDSDKPESIGEYHIDYLAKDVKEIIKALGFEKAVLVSHDWGGLVSWHVAAYYPDVISKLIVMNAPWLNLAYRFLLFHPIQLLKSWYIFFYQIPYLPEILLRSNDYKLIAGFFQGKGNFGIKNENNRLNNDEVEVYKYAISRNLSSLINYYRALNPMYKGLSLKRPTKQTIVPTLLIWGNADPSMDVRMVAYTKKLVKHVKTAIIEGAGHWVQQDEPEKVIKEMKEFLKKE